MKHWNRSIQRIGRKFETNLIKVDENHNKNRIFDEYKERLYHEIKIINQMKYSSYFLIVSDYIKWDKK